MIDGINPNGYHAARSEITWLIRSFGKLMRRLESVIQLITIFVKATQMKSH